MSLEKSKYASKASSNVSSADYATKKRIPKEANPWREINIHESNLIPALEFSMRMSTQLKGSEEIERVLVGEPVNGVYPLSVAIIKKGG